MKKRELEDLTPGEGVDLTAKERRELEKMLDGLVGDHVEYEFESGRVACCARRPDDGSWDVWTFETLAEHDEDERRALR